MKKEKIIYRVSTTIVVAVMLLSALNFGFNPAMKEAFAHLGLPGWFRIELTVAKLLGIVALVSPGIPSRLREFAYFGFAIVLLSAPIAHLSNGDSVLLEIGHSFFFASLVVSYVYYLKLKKYNLKARV